MFIPLSGALIAAWLRTRGVGWNTSSDAPVRPGMLLAWAAGFVAYQLVNPGAIPGWSDLWTDAGHLAEHPGPPVAVGLADLVRGRGAGRAAVRRYRAGALAPATSPAQSAGQVLRSPTATA